MSSPSTFHPKLSCKMSSHSLEPMSLRGKAELRRWPSLVNFEIRDATISDAEAISRLITSLGRFFLADQTSPEVRPFLETLTPNAMAGRIAAPNFSYYVAENNAGICGVIALRDGTHLYHLFVREDTHRQGIAHALWEHARARSDAARFTVNSSPYAVPAYEHLGFKVQSAPQSADGLVFVPMAYVRDG